MPVAVSNPKSLSAAGVTASITRTSSVSKPPKGADAGRPTTPSRPSNCARKDCAGRRPRDRRRRRDAPANRWRRLDQNWIGEDIQASFRGQRTTPAACDGPRIALPRKSRREGNSASAGPARQLVTSPTRRRHQRGPSSDQPKLHDAACWLRLRTGERPSGLCSGLAKNITGVKESAADHPCFSSSLGRGRSNQRGWKPNRAGDPPAAKRTSDCGTGGCVVYQIRLGGPHAPRAASQGPARDPVSAETPTRSSPSS